MNQVIAVCENNVGLITLNNPRIHNAIKMNDFELMRSAFLRWKGYKLDAILITGTGKSFCSGLFLDEFDRRSWDKNPISQICEDIENSDCPVICALNGGAYGGAVEIALSCDFRIANSQLSLRVPAANLGIHYEPTGLIRAINILGLSMTRRLFLLGQSIHIEDILRTDFVDFWTEEGETVIEKSKQILSFLRNNAPLAVAGMRKTISEILNNSLDFYSAEKRVEACFNSVDHKEALLAIKEKRPPIFKGL
ncbi:MAG: enoyl-CoA hydratase-related protein [Paracoccaceae bacterium]|nr:enoyl-CoA hydratase-related protein [Paracoccaceae bacterium]